VRLRQATELLEHLSRFRAEAERYVRRYLGPAQAVGLDIGADSAKAAQVVDRGEWLEVVLFGWTPLRGGEWGGGELPPAEAAARLQGFLEGWKFPTRRVVANLGGQDCLVRRLKLPFGDLKKAARMAPFELEADLPLSVPEMVLELFPLSANGGTRTAVEAAEGAEAGGNGAAAAAEDEAAPKAGGGLEVLALATTRQRLSERLALLAGANLSVSAVEADPLALYQAFRTLRPEEAEAADLAAVLDLGARKSTLLVVRGRELLSVRTIPLGGDAVSLALAALWGVPFAQAERIKRERCSVVAPGDESKVSQRRLEASRIVCQALEPLLREVRRTLLAVSPEELRSPDAPRCQRLYLCGGASLLPGLNTYLSRELGCPAAPLVARERLVVAAGTDPAAEALLPTALGLALRQLRRLSPVDFRRQELLATHEGAGPNWRLLYACAALLLSAIIGLADLHVRSAAREDRLAALKARAEEIYRGAVPGKGAVPDPLLLMSRKVTEAGSEPMPDLGGSQVALETLRAVAEAAAGENTKVKVVSLALEGATLHVDGLADNKDTVTRFRMALLKSNLFKDCAVKGVVPSRQKPGMSDFSLILKRA